MRAIVLAGGKGTRLAPYTAILPKPLMPVGQQAIIEILIRQLRNAGCHRITVAIGHLAHLVQAVLGNGEKWDVQINYSVELTPLGTSGPLTLINDLDETFLVLNGDVLTDLSFEAFLKFHREHGAVATIATHKRTVDIDYGIVHRNGRAITRYEEKPIINYEVSMGIYALEPSIMDYIPEGSYQDFPDLVQLLLNKGEKVLCYPCDGLWYDLGRAEDFQRVLVLSDSLAEAIPFFRVNPA
jgi:NDP-mannose synthase